PQFDSCHLQLACEAWHGTEVLITVSNGAWDRFRSMPTAEAVDLRFSISWVSSVVPLAYWRVNDSLSPALTPGPQCPAPLPGLAHTEVPPGCTVHPLLASRDLAADTLNGYGLAFSKLSTNGLAGEIGTGP